MTDPHPGPLPEGEGEVGSSDSLMQDADEGEEAARGFVVDVGFVLETGLKEAGALVVQAAAAHVDRLDALGAALLDGEHVAVDEELVVLDDAAERAEGEDDRRQWRVGFVTDIEDETAFLDREVKDVGAGREGSGVGGGEGEVIFVLEIGDGLGAVGLEQGR